MTDGTVLLQVTIRGGLPVIEFAEDEVLARYACDKARAAIDAEFLRRETMAKIQAAQSGVTIAAPNGQIRRMLG